MSSSSKQKEPRSYLSRFRLEFLGGTDFLFVEVSGQSQSRLDVFFPFWQQQANTTTFCWGEKFITFFKKKCLENKPT
jgi:hypothetical protein